MRQTTPPAITIPRRATRVKTSAGQAPKILLLYTGGTLGMVAAPRGGHLVPFAFERVLEQLPDLHRLELELTVLTFAPLLDSSDMQPAHWARMARLIRRHYASFDGFVIIHGTDTMAYSASALSFMLESLHKPVIFTGAQLPIGAPRTDARENLITALEIAAARTDQRPVVPGVSLFFNAVLLRGNRAHKIETAQFNAFNSDNYPPLAHAGIHIDYQTAYIQPYQSDCPLLLHPRTDANVAILKLFPGINQRTVEAVLRTEGLRGVVLETFGAGNTPTSRWFMECLRRAVAREVVLFNVSQCTGGRVMAGRYESSRALQQMGVVSGADITTEAAITKLMHLLGRETDPAAVRDQLGRNLRGEMSE